MWFRALAVLGVLAACEQRRQPPPAAAPVPLAVFQDDRQIATSAALGAKPRALVEVAPGVPDPERWLAVVVFDASGAATTAVTPAKNHPEGPPALVAGKDGVTFGFARGDELVDAVPRVVKVVIKTKDDRGAIAAELGPSNGAGDGAGGGHENEGKARPVPTAELTIAIKGPAGESVLTGDKLAALPSIYAPTGDTKSAGWNLTDVIAAAGLGGATAINLTDSEGANLRLDAADFDPKSTILYVKLNRNGQLRFRRFGKKGDAWEVTGELRGIKRIAAIP